MQYGMVQLQNFLQSHFKFDADVLKKFQGMILG